MNIIFQASALPFRIHKKELQILIISSRNKKKWIIPKGIIEPGDSDRYTALKETQEEAGVSGKILDPSIGTYSYQKLGSVCEVKLFPLKVEDVYDDWEESHFRKRKWVKGKRAANKVTPQELADLIEKFVNTVKIDLIEM